MSRFRQGSRIGFLLVLIVIVVGAGFLENHLPDHETSPRASATGENGASRVWYCAGGTGAVGQSIVVIANRGQHSAQIVVTAIGSNGKTVTSKFAVGTNVSRSVSISSMVQAPYVSAVVSSSTIGVTANIYVNGELGFGIAPCSSRIGSRWYFSDTSTVKDTSSSSAPENKTYLSLFNPSADAVSVTIEARAITGDDEPDDPSQSPAEDLRQPTDWQNISVAPRSLMVLDVGTQITRRVGAALTIRAIPGRIAVARTTLRRVGDRKGVSLVMGGTPSRASYFGYGYASSTEVERIMSYHPAGDVDAKLLMQPMYPTSNEISGIDAIERQIPPDTLDYFNVNADGRVPKNIVHSWQMESSLPLVIERSQDRPNEYAESLAATTTANQWAVSYIDTKTVKTQLAIANYTNETTKVTIELRGSGGFRRTQEVEIKPGLRQFITIADAPAGAIAIVRASGPVVVECVYSALHGNGYDVTAAIPVG